MNTEGKFTTNVQWKGTDLCMDFNCPDCACFAHFDGAFAHHVECPCCGALFKMPTELPIVKVNSLGPDDCVLKAETYR